MAIKDMNRKNPMKPLPVRVTPLQYDRLTQARARNGLAIQEHVRRALDMYLDKIERDAKANPASVAQISITQPLSSAPVAGSDSPFAGISTAPVLRSR
jgi:hypothetical protein